MRADHCRALAALARLRAEIHEHEAELESMALQIQLHESEMKSHDDAMHQHEQHGEGEQHKPSQANHDEITKRHQMLKKTFSDAASHHDDLIGGILEFSKKHSHKFHSSGQRENESKPHESSQKK